MRKSAAAFLVLAVFLMFGADAYAHLTVGRGECFLKYQTADLEKAKQFQHDTLQLRDQLMLRKVEIRRELLKVAPDRQKIAALQKEAVDIKTQIHDKADKAGLSIRGCGKIAKGATGGKIMNGRHKCQARL